MLFRRQSQTQQINFIRIKSLIFTFKPDLNFTKLYNFSTPLKFPENKSNFVYRNDNSSRIVDRRSIQFHSSLALGPLCSTCPNLYIMGGTTAQNSTLPNDHKAKREWSGPEEILIESYVACHWIGIMKGACGELGTVVCVSQMHLLLSSPAVRTCGEKEN